MIITLAAVTAATTTFAQRRSTSDSTNSGKVENTRSGNKNKIEKKSGKSDKADEARTTSRSAKNNSEVNRNTTSTKTETQKRVSQKPETTTGNKRRSDDPDYSNRSEQNRKENAVRIAKESDKNTKRENVNTDNSRRSTGYPAESNGNSSRENNSRDRNATRSNSERYNLDTNDSRYRVTRDYKGSEKYWSPDFRNSSRNNHNSAKNFNYNKYNHWDRNWEGYRWNHNSWVNYYSFYNPYSYRNSKYYYHHNYYGHVIRKFVYRPEVYIHNRVKYYCYDGYFFRYHRGVGYVLVDMPFGMAFDYLPNNYERVYINGYLYFRIGNLFFERTNYGFQLIYYPERYFAFNDGYRNEGFRFDDMGY